MCPLTRKEIQKTYSSITDLLNVAEYLRKVFSENDIGRRDIISRMCVLFVTCSVVQITGVASSVFFLPDLNLPHGAFDEGGIVSGQTFIKIWIGAALASPLGLLLGAVWNVRHPIHGQKWYRIMLSALAWPAAILGVAGLIMLVLLI